ncbi:AraC family transcriptional regulator [Psychrobacter sp. APC 3426]|uniref:AraC family transcriptional regulator n=1 Tax=Psychrobacter sp. APC 3426 TaxID=3035177 RepID=UPI0025B29D9F|nr:AraC family transcriptional regulator [Psychrobacter sp. APC 3426]MDN3398689.1 AraC family transcriptional regulator [Psychrobacter sp. APC 3426]
MNQSIIEQLLSILPKNKTIESAIPGLFFYCADKPSKAVSYIQEPSICIVLQGEREIYLGTDCQKFDNSNLMFCPVDIPLNMHVRNASIEDPVIVLSMKLNLAMISEVLAKIPPTQQNTNGHLGIKWQLDDAILMAFERLIDLLNYPNDIEFLSLLIQQEIYYRLLTAQQGYKLRQLVVNGSHTHRITQATDWIKSHLSELIIIEELASRCGMSVSGFHHHFKEITQLSPLQYQKSLRLMEARRLIQSNDLQVSQIAMQVGYESPSQFSREYKRLFGVSPSKELSE